MHVLQDGREWLHQSVFCSESLIVLNFSISSLSLATRLCRSSTRSGLTSHLSPLVSTALQHQCQALELPAAWTASCFCEISACVTISFLVILPPLRTHRPEEIRVCKPNFSSSLLFYCSTVIFVAATLIPIVDIISFFNKWCYHKKGCWSAGHIQERLISFQYFSFSLILQAQWNVSIKSSWSTMNCSLSPAAVKTLSILMWDDIKICCKALWIQSFQTRAFFKKKFLSKIQFELFLLLWIIQKTSLKSMTCFTSFKGIIQEKIFLFIWPYGRCCTSSVQVTWYWCRRWHINGVTSFTIGD